MIGKMIRKRLQGNMRTMIPDILFELPGQRQRDLFIDRDLFAALHQVKEKSQYERFKDRLGVFILAGIFDTHQFDQRPDRLARFERNVKSRIAFRIVLGMKKKIEQLQAAGERSKEFVEKSVSFDQDRNDRIFAACIRSNRIARIRLGHVAVVFVDRDRLVVFPRQCFEIPSICKINKEKIMPVKFLKNADIFVRADHDLLFFGTRPRNHHFFLFGSGRLVVIPHTLMIVVI